MSKIQNKWIFKFDALHYTRSEATAELRGVTTVFSVTYISTGFLENDSYCDVNFEALRAIKSIL